MKASLASVLERTLKEGDEESIPVKVAKLRPNSDSLAYKFASKLIEDIYSKHIVPEKFIKNQEIKAGTKDMFAYWSVFFALDKMKRAEFQRMNPVDEYDGDFFSVNLSARDRLTESLSIIFAFYGKQGCETVKKRVYSML